MRYLIFTLLLIPSLCFADKIKILKSADYDVELEQVQIPANQAISIVYDLDIIGDNVPDQLFATYEMEGWVDSFPGTISVSNDKGEIDKVIEVWKLSFVKKKSGGWVTMTREIYNNDTIPRSSYKWNPLIHCEFVKYKRGNIWPH